MTMHAAVARQRRVIAIDPGPTESAWLYLDGTTVVEKGKAPNALVLLRCSMWGGPGHEGAAALVIEKVQSYGMAVGAEVFETVYWSGRFAEAAQPLEVTRIGRKAIVTHLCGSARAKDSNVRAALIDRWGGQDAIHKGGALYGISGDCWSALAIACAYSDGVR